MSGTTDHTDARLAFIFPGQGSQSLGMVSALAAEFEGVKKRFEQASSVLGTDLWTMASEGPEEALNSTRNTQPALLAASVATWDAWRELGGALPAIMAGHSFGEYSALVCAGALDFETAVALVADRGRFMQEAVPAGEGAMAAILGLDLEAVDEACRQAAEGKTVCSPANLNAPGQIVIAGNAAAVDRACEAARELGAKRAMLIPVSAPAHCALMSPAAERLQSRLEETDFSTPAIAILHNIDVASRPDPEGIRSALTGQMTSPVRWIETIKAIEGRGIEIACECGPGKVLGALNKRIARQMSCHQLGTPSGLHTALSALKTEN